MCLCVFFEEMSCQPPRLAFFVRQTLALIKNLHGNVNWPGLRLGIITSSSLSVQAHAHTHAGTHMLSFTAQRGSSSWLLARPPFPNVPIYVSLVGKGATNTCEDLVPSSWGVRGRSASSLCLPESSWSFAAHGSRHSQQLLSPGYGIM